MNEESAIDGSWCAKSGRDCTIYGTSPTLNTVFVCPLNRKNDGCVEVL